MSLMTNGSTGEWNSMIRYRFTCVEGLTNGNTWACSESLTSGLTPRQPPSVAALSVCP
jgi:hypothetical protein